jgi:hypothetical protein
LLLFAFELDLNDGLASLVNDLEGEVLHVGLNFRISEFPADQSLGVEDSILRVHRDLILGGITNETLSVGKGDKGWGGSVALVVGNNLNSVISEDAYT